MSWAEFCALRWPLRIAAAKIGWVILIVNRRDKEMICANTTQDEACSIHHNDNTKALRS